MATFPEDLAAERLARATVRIPLRARDGSVRAYALIDRADAALADKRWSLTRPAAGLGYAVRRVWDPVSKAHAAEHLHRVIVGLEPGDPRVVDHINRDRLDNRRANLRVVTRGENAQNAKPRGGSSRHRGVYSNGRGGWCVKVGRRHIGTFPTERDAADAAREARARLLPVATD